MVSFSQAINQQLLDKYFGPGVVQAGSGRGEAALANASPQIIAAYTRDRQQYDGQQNYNPNGGTSYNGGVSPVGQIEPLNDWQKQALTTMQSGYQDPGFSNAIFSALQNQQNAASAIPSSMTPQQFQQLYTQYQNPYQQDVVNTTNADIQRQAQILKNPIKEQLAGNNSFGSSAQGIENGQIDDATLRAIAANTANLNSQGYQSAVGNALNTNAQNYNQALGKTGAFQSLLGSGIAGQQAGQQNFSQNVGNAFNAGSAVQNQNQNLLNVVQGQIQGIQQYPYTQLSNFASLLSPYTGSSSSGYQYSPSSISQLGGLGLLGASGIFGGLGGGSTSSYTPYTPQFSNAFSGLGF